MGQQRLEADVYFRWRAHAEHITRLEIPEKGHQFDCGSKGQAPFALSCLQKIRNSHTSRWFFDGPPLRLPRVSFCSHGGSGRPRRWVNQVIGSPTPLRQVSLVQVLHRASREPSEGLKGSSASAAENDNQPVQRCRRRSGISMSWERQSSTDLGQSASPRAPIRHVEQSKFKA